MGDAGEDPAVLVGEGLAGAHEAGALDANDLIPPLQRNRQLVRP
jgi:hypothetical protein